MNKIVSQTLGKRASEISSQYEVNCFTTVISYFRDELLNGRTSAQDMLDWLQAHTTQVDTISVGSIVVFWSSSNVVESPDKVEIKHLRKDKPGYPFGLVMEHAAVFISKDEVFQKASPKDEDLFEIIRYSNVRSAYEAQFPWLRITIHEATLESKSYGE